MIETIREALGYGTWVGLLILIVVGVLIAVFFGKKDKRWYWFSVAMFAFIVLIIILQFIGT